MTAMQRQTLLSRPFGLNMGAEKVLTPAQQAAPHIKALTGFIGPMQLRCVRDGLRGEEGQFFADKLKELAEIVARMPGTYEARRNLADGESPTVWLHYFAGGQASCWIVEKDVGTADDAPEDYQSQAYGLADLFNDGGEIGYISLPEWLGNRAELDFHFKPCTLAELRLKRGHA